MKKALPNTKVTVKLRRSNYKEAWNCNICFENRKKK